MSITKTNVRLTLLAGLSFLAGAHSNGNAQEEPVDGPVELEVIRHSIGEWDIAVEVWAQGPENPTIKFKGVETNRPFGNYWLSSDMETEFMGQTMKVHSIIGYDLVEKKLVGKVVDHGPYAATMTGEYDVDSKTVTWMTHARDEQGNPMVQKTTITHQDPDTRILTLLTPAEGEDQFTKFMEIKYTRKK